MQKKHFDAASKQSAYRLRKQKEAERLFNAHERLVKAIRAAQTTGQPITLELATVTPSLADPATMLTQLADALAAATP